MPFDPARVQDAVRAAALAYPESHEDRPWDHPAFKVRKKAFVFMGEHDDKLSISLKLPESSEAALQLPWCKPTGYGLGRYGWVSVTIPAEDDLPIDALIEWIDESFRAVAPKTVVKKQLPPEEPPEAAVAALEALGT
ncbi:MAG: MmcQ/YjbR family DNA-binding protein [Deltaproteobacteria bacterium]|nr:MmcQ/YjbR family DNA-binding protein [Deltaproteobacteria bacterium]